MPVQVFCPGCQKKLRVPETAQGKRVKCLACTHVFHVPSATVEPRDDPEPVRRPSKPRLAPREESFREEDEDLPRRVARSKRRDPEYDDEDDQGPREPRRRRSRDDVRRRPKQSSGAMVWIIVAASVLVAVLGGGLTWLLIRNASRDADAMVQKKAGFQPAPAPVNVPAGPGKLNAALWQEFSSPPGRFKITFPGQPKYSTQREPVKNQIFHQFEVLQIPFDLGFFVHYVDLPPAPNPPPPDLFFESLRGGVLSDFPGGRLTREERVQVNGHLGREYSIAMPIAQVIRRVYLVNNRMYMVTVSGSRLEQHRGDSDRYFNSFQVTGP